MTRASKKAGSTTSSKADKRSSSRKEKTPKAPLSARELAAVGDEEPMSQVTLKMRESQHRQLAKMAFTQGTTMRGVIMRALKVAGLKVTKQDLVDRRRR